MHDKQDSFIKYDLETHGFQLVVKERVVAVVCGGMKGFIRFVLVLFFCEASIRLLMYRLSMHNYLIFVLKELQLAEVYV